MDVFYLLSIGPPPLDYALKPEIYADAEVVLIKISVARFVEPYPAVTCVKLDPFTWEPTCEQLVICRDVARVLQRAINLETKCERS